MKREVTFHVDTHYTNSAYKKVPLIPANKICAYMYMQVFQKEMATI